jgi:hypothetical protein
MNTFNQINKENINPLDKILYLYVPRASLKSSEVQVKDLFFRNQIGNVEYCDLVIIKDKETKQPLYAQLFIKLNCWNMFSNAKADFERNGSIKIFLTDSEFWIILPNKNPLPRTHVNNSQLAASTEKLFEKSEAMEKKLDSFEDEMRSEMAEMRLFIKLQQQSIEALKIDLISANTNIEQLRQDNIDLTYQLKRSNTAIYGHNTIDEYEAAEDKKTQDKKLVEDNKEQDQFDVELDAILDMPIMPPKLSRTASIALEVSDPLAIPVLHLKSKICDEDECIFSLNKIPRSLSPVPIISSRSEPEPLSLADIVLKNPEKAIASRDFCGNC